MPALPVAPDQQQIVGNERIAMEGERLTISLRIVSPFHPAIVFVERADHAVAGAHDQ
jgi:hypothetical protein